MDLVQESHQIIFFTDNSDITTAPPIIVSILTAISKYNLIPTFGQELNGFTGEKKQILIMTNSEQNLKVEFPAGAIVISGGGSKIEDFYSISLGIINDLALVFPHKKFSRVAHTNAKAFHASSEKYQTLYQSLFTYKTVEPFEWDNKIALRERIDFKDEVINSISAIRRCEISAPVFQNGKPFDAILTEVDSNTLPVNDSSRFSWQDALVVLGFIFNNNISLLDKIKRYIVL